MRSRGSSLPRADMALARSCRRQRHRGAAPRARADRRPGLAIGAGVGAELRASSERSRTAWYDRIIRRFPCEQFAADQHAADFAGAGADFVQLGVAQQAPGRVVVDIAVAAESWIASSAIQVACSAA